MARKSGREATTLEEKIKTVMEAQKKKVTPSPTPKIQKVIFLLRDNKDFVKVWIEVLLRTRKRSQMQALMSQLRQRVRALKQGIRRICMKLAKTTEVIKCFDIRLVA